LVRSGAAIERCETHGQPCADRFGRTLARIQTPQGEAGAILMREALALPYVPGGRKSRTQHWCGG
jgi:hypothetical protein